MRTASILVVGPEGSGTTILWRCICAHPDLAGLKALNAPRPGQSLPAEPVLLHLSLPTLRPMRWVGPQEVPSDSKVVLIQRSPIHTVFSAYRRMYSRAGPGAAWRSYFEAVRLQNDYGKVRDCLRVAYEDLVAHPKRTLSSIYRFLGVAEDFSPDLVLRDQNDLRWMRSPKFFEFMTAAFGDTVGAHGSPEPPGAREPAVQAKEKIGAPTTQSRWHFEYRGTKFALDASLSFWQQLRKAVPEAVPTVESESPEVRYTVRKRVSGPGIESRGCMIFRNSRPRYSSARDEKILQWLVDDANETVESGGDTVCLTLRGSAVVWRRRAILLLGDAGSGKSHLAAELVRAGAAPYSDGQVVIDGSGRIHPDGATEFEGARVGLMISTYYHPGAVWKPRSLRGSRALLPMIARAVADDGDLGRTLSTCASLGSAATTLDGPRPDVSEVAEPILAALDEILDRDQRS